MRGVCGTQAREDRLWGRKTKPFVSMKRRGARRAHEAAHEAEAEADDGGEAAAAAQKAADAAQMMDAINLMNVRVSEAAQRRRTRHTVTKARAAYSLSPSLLGLSSITPRFTLAAVNVQRPSALPTNLHTLRPSSAPSQL